MARKITREMAERLRDELDRWEPDVELLTDILNSLGFRPPIAPNVQHVKPDPIVADSWAHRTGQAQ